MIQIIFKVQGHMINIWHSTSLVKDDIKTLLMNDEFKAHIIVWSNHAEIVFFLAIQS